jgi:hypothetical protein
VNRNRSHGNRKETDVITPQPTVRSGAPATAVSSDIAAVRARLERDLIIDGPVAEWEREAVIAALCQHLATAEPAPTPAPEPVAPWSCSPDEVSYRSPISWVVRRSGRSPT